MSTLDPLFTAAEIAEGTRQTERYVRDQARRGLWPHRKGARGVPLFSAADYAQILELIAVPVSEPASPRMSFAPRSRRRSAA